MVELTMVAVPELGLYKPAPLVAELPLIVESVITSVPLWLAMPAPVGAELSVNVESVAYNVL